MDLKWLAVKNSHSAITGVVDVYWSLENFTIHRGCKENYSVGFTLPAPFFNSSIFMSQWHKKNIFGCLYFIWSQKNPINFTEEGRLIHGFYFHIEDCKSVSRILASSLTVINRSEQQLQIISHCHFLLHKIE